MRKFTTEYTVYTFDELSTEAQARAIEDHRNGMDYPFLTDDMSYRLEELLAENKIKYEFTPNVYYRLAYSQGDGAMFEGTVNWKQYTVTIKQSGHYYHENSKNLDIDLTNGNNISMAVYERVESEFNEIYVAICKELARYGYSIIEDATSDESISTYLTEMEYEFYEDGSMA